MKNESKKPDTTEAQEEFDQAKKAALEAYGNFIEAKEHLKAAAQNAGIEFRESANEQFNETVERMTERRRELLADATDYIRDNPLSSAGFAFLGGMIVSRLMSSR